MSCKPPTRQEGELITKKPDDSTAQDETATLVFGPTSTATSTALSGTVSKHASTGFVRTFACARFNIYLYFFLVVSSR
ncbi:hypothetical protein LB504_008083 [Fusarium proliferatum]|nr:hypothetical protein LB504_008083 [Fusarium proliferatum]